MGHEHGHGHGRRNSSELGRGSSDVQGRREMSWFYMGICHFLPSRVSGRERGRKEDGFGCGFEYGLEDTIHPAERKRERDVGCRMQDEDSIKPIK
jgi:hypothetical protein